MVFFYIAKGEGGLKTSLQMVRPKNTKGGIKKNHLTLTELLVHINEVRYIRLDREKAD
jgi:hypothetical protein